jgi:hypothetical protein
MALIAAILWFVSARIEVPDNIDTIVRRLQRIGFWNGWASVFSVSLPYSGRWMSF